MAQQNINQYVYPKLRLNIVNECMDMSLASDEMDFNQEVVFSPYLIAQTYGNRLPVSFDINNTGSTQNLTLTYKNYNENNIFVSENFYDPNDEVLGCYSSSTACDIGLTGIDNGLVDKMTGETIHYTNGLYDDSLKFERLFFDKRLKMFQVTGYTSQNERFSGFPKTTLYEVVTKTGSTEGVYHELYGGFYQGFYKLFGYEYDILPERMNKGWSIEMILKPRLYNEYFPSSGETTLNEIYPQNKNTFFYLGTRSENKFYHHADGSPKCDTGYTRVTSGLTNCITTCATCNTGVTNSRTIYVYPPRSKNDQYDPHVNYGCNKCNGNKEKQLTCGCDCNETPCLTCGWECFIHECKSPSYECDIILSSVTGNTVIIDTINFVGQTAEIIFHPYTGGTEYFGFVTLPYTFNSSYPYGMYEAFFPEIGKFCYSYLMEPEPEIINNCITTPVCTNTCTDCDTCDECVDCKDCNVSGMTSIQNTCETDPLFDSMSNAISFKLCGDPKNPQIGVKVLRFTGGCETTGTCVTGQTYMTGYTIDEYCSPNKIYDYCFSKNPEYLDYEHWFQVNIVWERNETYDDCDLVNKGGLGKITEIKYLDSLVNDTVKLIQPPYTHEFCKKEPETIELVNLNDIWLDEKKFRMGKLKIYVNGKLFWTIDDFEEIIPRGLNTDKEKQLAVPFNISWGGGTQGLHENLTFSSCTGLTGNYIQDPECLPINVLSGTTLNGIPTNILIEQNFAGTFEGAISQFRMYVTPLSASEVKHNFSLLKDKFVMFDPNCPNCETLFCKTNDFNYEL